MILAIIERYENVKEETPFNERFYLNKYFKNIFDELNILLFPIMSECNLEKVSEVCDGLIITGSNIDIDPRYYNEKSNTKSNLIVDEYILDSKIINKFVEKKKPILGICGGLQSINVYFGGSLNQDVENHNLINEKHMIKIEKESFLYNTYDKTQLYVNSFHHQAIKNVAEGFKVTAISEDGIIEAIEKENIIGVQWHPEALNDILFFKSFIDRYFN